MADVKDILESILSDEKLLGSRVFRDKLYTDQPIIKRASQIKSPETPQKIKEMKSLAYTQEAYWKTSSWLFYTQGKFMEEYTDVYEYSSDFVRYYPTYRDLDTDQLRGYFSWRTRLKNGDFPIAPIPFIYIRAYELINGIGKETPEERIVLLKSLISKYGKLNAELNRLLNRWTVDYCVYEQLDPSTVEDLPDLIYDNALIILLNWNSSDDETLFEALDVLSGYPFERSRYYIENVARFKEVAVRVFRKLSVFFQEHRKKSFCDHLFGHPTEINCHLFESAVFYERNATRNADYSLNDIHSFTCRNGQWRCRRYYGNRSRSPQLGEIMKMVDYLLREHDNYRYKLRPADVSKSTTKLIVKEIEIIEEEKRREKAMSINIDLSKLEGIRAAADKTRNKLIVDDETEEFISEPISENYEELISDSPLNSGEILFLRALINKEDWSSVARKIGEMPSLLSDSINEKLFDLFGDTVIDCSSDVPLIVDDYVDDLEKYV